MSKAINWRQLAAVMLAAAVAAAVTYLTGGRPPATPPPAAVPDVAPVPAVPPPAADEPPLAAPTCMLSGDALVGVDAGPVPRLAAAAMEPQTVCLGAVRPREAPRVPQLGGYLRPFAASPPATTGNRRAKATGPLGRMYLNDRMGCCVISGKYHQLGFASAADGGPAIEVDDATIADQYRRLKVPRGEGCVITDVLDHFRRVGLPVSGATHKIDGYVAVDPRNPDQVRAALYLFGTLTLGIDLPQSWTQSAVWDVTNSRSLGGHDVAAVDYDADGVYVSSWGKVYRMTWPALTSGRYVAECYAQLHPDWYGSDKLAPCGLDADRLRADLVRLGQGEVPDVGPPAPLPPGPGRRTITIRTPELDAAGVYELTVTLTP